MAKPKRFNSIKGFELQMNRVIEELIEKRTVLFELERKDVQVTDIAIKFDVTTNTLRRWCKEYMGISVREFLAKHRVERAKILLKMGCKPSGVANQLAFVDHKTFSTTFKRYQRVTPSGYMKSQCSVDSPNHTQSNK